MKTLIFLAILGFGASALCNSVVENFKADLAHHKTQIDQY